MKDMSFAAKMYVLGVILIGAGLIGSSLGELDWMKAGLYVLAALGAVAQTLKVEGPNDRTNYSIAWFVYGFTLIAHGPAAAIFVVVAAHVVEGLWHKYPWYIQSFNIGSHVLAVYLAGVTFSAIGQGTRALDLQGAMGMAAASLVFVLVNHFLVGMVVKLARGQSFAESGVFGSLTLFLDFTVLSMGAVTALIWAYNPFATILNILPLWLLYQALRVPALLRQLQVLKQVGVAGDGD